MEKINKNIMVNPKKEDFYLSENCITVKIPEDLECDFHAKPFANVEIISARCIPFEERFPFS